MNIDSERDALGEFNRKSMNKEVRNIMLISIPILVVGMFGLMSLQTPQDKQDRLQAEYHLRDKWDCTHIQQDMVYRGWNTPRQDNTDPYFVYDLKLHDQRGCKP